MRKVCLFAGIGFILVLHQVQAQEKPVMAATSIEKKINLASENPVKQPAPEMAAYAKSEGAASEKNQSEKPAVIPVLAPYSLDPPKEKK